MNYYDEETRVRESYRMSEFDKHMLQKVYSGITHPALYTFLIKFFHSCSVSERLC